MNPAIIAADMLKDTFKKEVHFSMTLETLRIIPIIKKFLDHGRRMAWPIIFARDSFLEGNFIFQGRMKPHSMRGTKGAEDCCEAHKKGECRAALALYRDFALYPLLRLEEFLKEW
ncbi:MAG: hypothetical protein JSW70_05000 [Syntrophobacterales bacterium]|nr:MAG: hypothetical protein JSW70_05000 [Syntrophobacterales bacterium]